MKTIYLALLVLFTGLWLCPPQAEAQPSPTDTNGLVYVPLDTWSFYDFTNWTSDLGYAPASVTNLSYSWLGNGQSVVIDTNIPAWLSYNIVETNDLTNLTVDAGTVMFWFGPDWSSVNIGGSGPGGWAQLLNVGEWTSDASNGYWGLVIDPPGNNLQFISQDGLGDTYSLSTPISWSQNYFHFITLTYSSTNVSIYLDGTLATNDSGGLSIWPGTNVLANGFFIGSDTNGLVQAHGMFNNLFTYNAPLDGGTIQGMFSGYLGDYLINPENEAMEIPSAGDSLQPVLISSDQNTIPGYTPEYNVFSGLGNLIWVTNVNSATNSNYLDVWFTNVTAYASGVSNMTVAFTVAGGSVGVPYDVFASSVLSFGTNGVPWAWEGQCFTKNTYEITNLSTATAPTCFLILGTAASPGFGLTDAYELLVAKIGTNVTDQIDSYNIPYAWYAENGILPFTAGMATNDPDHDAILNYQEYEYGTRPMTNEGFTIWTGLQNVNTSIP